MENRIKERKKEILDERVRERGRRRQGHIYSLISAMTLLDMYAHVLWLLKMRSGIPGITSPLTHLGTVCRFAGAKGMKGVRRGGLRIEAD